MILSVFFTDYWYSYAVLDENNLKVIKHGFANWKYNSNVFSKQITGRKIEALLNQIEEKLQIEQEEQNQGSAGSKQVPATETSEKNHLIDKYVLTSFQKVHNDIHINYSLDEIASLIPYTVILVDHYYNHSFKVLNLDELNSYMNYKSYGIPIDYKVKFKLDYMYLREFFKTNTDKYMGKENLLFLTHGLLPEKRKEYIELVCKCLADNTQIGGIWKLSIDDRFSVVPLIAALLSANYDLNQFFTENPIHSDSRLIIAPEVKEYEFSTNANEKGKGDFVTEPLKANDLNHLDLSAQEHIYIKWKNHKSRFKGTIYGSETGVYIDTRNPYEKN